MPVAQQVRGGTFKGYIEGGPELAAALDKLDEKLRKTGTKDAAEAGANVIADDWRVQVRNRINRGPGTGHYPDAIGVKARATGTGALASIGLPNEVPLSAGEDHPRVYAPRLEFGDSARAAQPTLRPAFDAGRGRALDKIAEMLRHLIEGT